MGKKIQTKRKKTIPSCTQVICDEYALSYSIKSNLLPSLECRGIKLKTREDIRKWIEDWIQDPDGTFWGYVIAVPYEGKVYQAYKNSVSQDEISGEYKTKYCIGNCYGVLKTDVQLPSTFYVRILNMKGCKCNGELTPSGDICTRFQNKTVVYYTAKGVTGTLEEFSNTDAVSLVDLVSNERMQMDAFLRIPQEGLILSSDYPMRPMFIPEMRSESEYSYAINCDKCEGEGTLECDKCEGSGKWECEKCEGQGHLTCNKCDGNGYLECRRCGGTGKVECRKCSGTGRVECRKCGGSGSFIGKYGDYLDCRVCDGDGYLECNCCDGDGELDCRGCDGTGHKECFACSGAGTIECYVCKGQGSGDCHACDGEGEIECFVCKGRSVFYVNYDWKTKQFYRGKKNQDGNFEGEYSGYIEDTSSVFLFKEETKEKISINGSWSDIESAVENQIKKNASADRKRQSLLQDGALVKECLESVLSFKQLTEDTYKPITIFEPVADFDRAKRRVIYKFKVKGKYPWMSENRPPYKYGTQLQMKCDGFFLDEDARNSVRFEDCNIEKHTINISFPFEIDLSLLEGKDIEITPAQPKPSENRQLEYLRVWLDSDKNPLFDSLIHDNSNSKIPDISLFNPGIASFPTQKKAVELGVSDIPLVLLQGPPGTGKTTVIVEIILQMLSKGKRVLVTSQTHQAVCNVLEKLHKLKIEKKEQGIQMVRYSRDESKLTPLEEEYQAGYQEQERQEILHKVDSSLKQLRQDIADYTSDCKAYSEAKEEASVMQEMKQSRRKKLNTLAKEKEDEDSSISMHYASERKKEGEAFENNRRNKTESIYTFEKELCCIESLIASNKVILDEVLESLNKRTNTSWSPDLWKDVPLVIENVDESSIPSVKIKDVARVASNERKALFEKINKQIKVLDVLIPQYDSDIKAYKEGINVAKKIDKIVKKTQEEKDAALRKKSNRLNERTSFYSNQRNKEKIKYESEKLDYENRIKALTERKDALGKAIDSRNQKISKYENRLSKKTENSFWDKVWKVSDKILPTVQSVSKLHTCLEKEQALLEEDEDNHELTIDSIQSENSLLLSHNSKYSAFLKQSHADEKRDKDDILADYLKEEKAIQKKSDTLLQPHLEQQSNIISSLNNRLCVHNPYSSPEEWKDSFDLCSEVLRFYNDEKSFFAAVQPKITLALTNKHEVQSELATAIHAHESFCSASIENEKREHIQNNEKYSDKVTNVELKFTQEIQPHENTQTNLISNLKLPLQSFTLDTTSQEWEQCRASVEEKLESLSRKERFKAQWARELGASPEALGKFLNSQVKVFMATCVGVGGWYELLKGTYERYVKTDMISGKPVHPQFDLVIIDEAGHATFGETVIPMLFGKRVLMVGDDKQLPPVCGDDLPCRQHKGKECVLGDNQKSDCWLEYSLFEYLWSRTNRFSMPRLMLDTQFRMHPDIGSFVSQAFYDGKLKNGTSAPNRHFTFSSFSRPVCVLSTSSQKKRFESRSKRDDHGSVAYSYSNPIEAEYIQRIVEALIDDLAQQLIAGKKEEKVSLAIITPYSNQVQLLRTQLKGCFNSSNHLAFTKDDIASVDKFQGSERDIVITSFVRSPKTCNLCNGTGRSKGNKCSKCNGRGHEGGSFSFVHDLKRMNVAFSRAKKMLILVGDIEALCKYKGNEKGREILTDFYNYVSDRGKVMRVWETEGEE